MSWKRKREEFTANKGLRIDDDDGDWAHVVQQPSGAGLVIYVHSGMGIAQDRQGIHLNEKDARALRKFINEWLTFGDDDDE